MFFKKQCIITLIKGDVRRSLTNLILFKKINKYLFFFHNHIIMVYSPCMSIYFLLLHPFGYSEPFLILDLLEYFNGLF